MAETFEDHIKAVEDGVRDLEAGEETLGRSLEIYENAIRHLKVCYDLLSGAEGRVKVLSVDEEGNLREEDFRAEPEGE